MGVKKAEIIWTFFCKAGLTYTGDRSAVEFPLDVGSWRENVPGVLDCCISLLTIWDFPHLEYLPVPQRVGSYISFLPMKPGFYLYDILAWDLENESEMQALLMMLLLWIFVKPVMDRLALCVLRGSWWIQQVWCGSGASIDLLVSLCFAEIYVLYKLKVCGNHVLNKVIGAIFPTALFHFMSLYQILVILTICQTFSLLLYLLQWYVIYYYYSCFGTPWTVPTKRANLTDQCVFSDCPTQLLLPFLFFSPQGLAIP